jgi:hypothetical protein
MIFIAKGVTLFLRALEKEFSLLFWLTHKAIALFSRRSEPFVD